MSRMNSASPLREASNPLLKSFAYLPTAIIGKLKRTNKMAPESYAKDREIAYVVELACGHVLCKKNDDKQSGARFRLSNSNSVLANLSIFEATRCPMCEHDLLADKDIGSQRNSALLIAEKHVGPDTKRGPCGLERRQSTSDERSREVSEPSGDERLDARFVKTDRSV